MCCSNSCFLSCITGFSRGRLGELIIPSPSELSTVYFDPHSQRLWHSQQSRNKCFLELSCFFDDPADVGDLISGSSAFYQTSLNIWKFMVHVLLKPGLKNFEHYFTSVRDECNCVVVWAFFGRGQTHWNQNHRKLANLTTRTTALSNSMKLSHTVWGHPRWMGHGGEVWQNVVHWRREQQTTSVFLPSEPHEQYEKAKWQDTERGTPQVSRCPIYYRRSVEK